jgi:hypothetical protein
MAKWAQIAEWADTTVAWVVGGGTVDGVTAHLDSGDCSSLIL